MTESGSIAKKVRFTREHLESLSKEELIQSYLEQENSFVDLFSKTENNGTNNKELDDRLKQCQADAMRRENVLKMKLSQKEQEVSDYLNQISDLKQAVNPSATQLRCVLLDPAVNLMFQRMKLEVGSCKEKLEQAQNDLAAWKFTPDSQSGKRLMARCRTLLQENEELGKVISAGRTAKLEGEIALEKTLVQEMKTSQAELDEFLVELDEDVEGMQSTIYILQKQLKETKDELSQTQLINNELRAQLSKQQHQRIPLAGASSMAANRAHEFNSPPSATGAAALTVDNAEKDVEYVHARACPTPPSSSDHDLPVVEADGCYVNHTLLQPSVSRTSSPIPLNSPNCLQDSAEESLGSGTLQPVSTNSPPMTHQQRSPVSECRQLSESALTNDFDRHSMETDSEVSSVSSSTHDDANQNMDISEYEPTHQQSSKQELNCADTRTTMSHVIHAESSSENNLHHNSTSEKDSNDDEHLITDNGQQRTRKQVSPDPLHLQNGLMDTSDSLEEKEDIS